MGVKISELNEALSVQNSDMLPIVQEGETKKIQVETLGSQKVNKTGDTLTGELLFENKNVYDAIRKTRTFNNEDYQVSVGVGGNMSARMEFVKVPNNVLSSVEARSDGIYNGVSGNKLLEEEKVVSVTSDFKIENQSCFKLQNSLNIGINIYNENSTYGTYSWVQLARLPVGSRPSGEKYITGAGFGAGWSNAIAVPIMIDANGYINSYLRTADLKRIIANGIITL